ncbi:aminoglycoside phosphotransferase family protein [bacterium]|nr:aminoglycoside phosphotransferase family protein [bacterium]
MDSKTKNRKTKAELTRMVKKNFAGATLAAGEDAVRELEEGWFNAVYDIRLSDGRSVILKIAPPGDAEVMTYEQNIMLTEVETMRLAAQNPAILVPKIYAYDASCELCDSDYFFMEKLRGENLANVRASYSPEEQIQIDHSIGAIVREINNLRGTYFGYEGNSSLRAETWREAFIKIVDSILADGEQKGAEYGFDVQGIRDLIQQHAGALEAVTTPRLVHWDAWDLNFFVEAGRITGLLDFERALWGDPLMEAHFRVLSWDGVTDVMRGYGKDSFTHDEMTRCQLYTLHLGLVMKTECYYRNYDTDEVSNMAAGMLPLALNWLREN